MAGAGSRRDEVPSINSNNIFAALGSLKKKKKKEQGSSKSNDKEPEKEVYWAPAPLTVKSWADVDEDDDDDYYATTAPPESVWSASGAEANSETVKENEAAEEESESEDEGLDDAEDDAEEEHENEPESPAETESVLKLPPEPSSTTKETERQLSKKELKKKGLEELEAVLAELGYTQREPSSQDDSHATKDATLEKKEGEGNGEMERKDNASGESKSAKKKKKKDKSLKEQKGSQDHPDGVDVENTISETGDTEKAEDVSAVDVKERLKKVASMKKKKSSKEMDAAARAAASEAAARNAKLAAASKKKEKAHYNQQPVR